MNEQKQNLSGFAVFINMGTTAIDVINGVVNLASGYGGKIIHGLNSWIIRMDTHLDPQASATDLPTSTFIPAELADPQSRKQMAASGQLPFLDPGEIDNPGIQQEDMGSGGIPSWGRARFRMNRQFFTKLLARGMRRFQDYGQQRAIATEDSTRNSALPIFVITSTVGGTGGSATADVRKLVYETAAELNIRVNLTWIFLDLGTIFPPNKAQAVRNRQQLLTQLWAQRCPHYVDLEGGITDGIGLVSESVLVFQNVNDHGELSTIKGLKGLVTHFLFNLAYTETGRCLRRHGVDLQATVDRDHFVSTAGISVINLDRQRIKGFLGSRLAAWLCRSLLAADPGQAEQDGENLAWRLQLVESEAESQGSRHLVVGEDGKTDVFQEAQGAFADRVGQATGWLGCQAVHGAYRSVTAELIPLLVGRMKQRAAKTVVEAKTQITADLATKMKMPNGLNSSKASLDSLCANIGRSLRLSGEKLRLSSEASAPVLEQIDTYSNQVEGHNRRSWLGRALRSLSMSELCRQYRHNASWAIRLALEQEVHRVLTSMLTEIHTFVTNELGRLVRFTGRMDGSAIELEQHAQMLLDSEPSPLQTPVGMELAGRAFLETTLKDLFQKKGGPAKLLGQAFEHLMGQSGSLAAFIDSPQESLREALLDVTKNIFQTEIETLHVLDVFCDKHTPEQITNLVAQAVGESRGRLRVSGEVNKEISWKKVIGVPAGRNSQFLQREADQADLVDGDWELVELSDQQDTILFVQYRSGISIRSLIEQHDSKTANQRPAEKVQFSAWPDCALLPAGKPTIADARTAAAKAVILDTLKYDQRTGYSLQWKNGQTESLGKSPWEALSLITDDFDLLVGIHGAFCKNLAKNSSTLMDKLGNLSAQLESGNLGELEALVDQEAFSRVVEEAQALGPFLKQLPGHDTGSDGSRL